jgi:hypothetical protein
MWLNLYILFFNKTQLFSPTFIHALIAACVSRAEKGALFCGAFGFGFQPADPTQGFVFPGPTHALGSPA